MYHASNGFIDTLRFGSLIVESRITVYSGGSPTTYVLPISELQLTVDRHSAQRTSGTMTVELVPQVPPVEPMPTSASSLLAPFGNEIFVEISVVADPTVTKEWIPLGLLEMATTTVDDTSIDMTITFQLYDRSWIISQRKFLQPYNIPAASGNFVDEITTLLNTVWGSSPALQFNITPTSATVPTASYNQGADPWQAALDMANAVGYELFFDRNGIVVGYPIPDPSTQPVVWNFAEDDVSAQGTYNHAIGQTPYQTPIATQVTFTRDRVYNNVYVAATGTQNLPGSASGSSAPFQVNAADTNPKSPTYYLGKMGDVPEFVQSSLATTTATAQAMADNLLQAALAQAWQIMVTAPQNPLIEIDDVVTVSRSRLGLSNQKMVVDRITTSVRYDATTQISGRVVPD